VFRPFLGTGPRHMVANGQYFIIVEYPVDS